MISALALSAVHVVAADRQWQRGYWRDSELQTVQAGSVTIPIGGTPPTTVAGVTVQGTPPTLLTFPSSGTVQAVVIDGDDGITYTAVRQVRAAWPVVVNDEITFAVDGERLYTKDSGKPGTKEFWFKIVKRVRRP